MVRVLKKKKKAEQKLSKSHLFRRKILHPSRHAVPKHSEIPGCERRGVLAEIVEILPGAMISKIGQQFPVHHVLEYEIMRLCEQNRAHDYQITRIAKLIGTIWKVSR